MGGPLDGIRVVELAALGPAPYAAMLLADLGAEVIRVDRPGAGGPDDLGRQMVGVARGRRSVVLDLKRAPATALLLELTDRADVLIEGFRPGVAERLGIGPDVVTTRNPRLIYCRVTGYGQTGPDARAAGHDLNYLAVAGILHGLGDPDRPPPPPLAYLGDLGAGGTFAVIGVLAALLERGRSGCGQVVDAAVLDGAASLSAYAHGLASIGEWSSERGRNFADGSTPYYRCYATSDGGYVAVASIEPKFYSALLATLGMEPEDWPQQDRSRWPALRAQLERRFAERPRAHWAKQFDGAEACVTPVLELNEAPDHEHNRARGAFVATASGWTPAVAPRLTRTSSAPGELGQPGEHTDSILADLGYAPAAVAALRTAGAVG